MTRDRPPEATFALGAWRVDPQQGLLSGSDGKAVRLEPQLMSLLLLFAGSPGRVIAKDEIIARVWQGRAIGDDTLAASISRLRSALGETKEQRFIETLPKRGYRFLVAPEEQRASPAQADDVDGLIAKGRAQAQMPLPPALVQARLYFERAIALDPKRAEAHVGLADVMLLQVMTGQDRQAVLVPAAKAAAQAAVALDESSASAWTSLGFATLLADRDFEAADSALLRAIACNPDFARAHSARAFALAAIGRFVEAERAARRAIALDPVSLAARRDLLQGLLLARRYHDAIVEAKRALALSADSFDAWSAKGWAHAMLGQEEEAVSALLEHLKRLGADAATIARVRDAYEQGGFEGFCRSGADLFETQRVFFVPRPLDIAMLRALGGETDKAFAALERVLEHNDPVLVFLPYLPFLDRIRNDPRFADFAARAHPVRAKR